MGRSVCLLVLPSSCFSSLKELKAISAALVNSLISSWPFFGLWSSKRSGPSEAEISFEEGFVCDPALGSWLPPTYPVARVPQAELLCWGKC